MQADLIDNDQRRPVELKEWVFAEDNGLFTVPARDLDGAFPFDLKAFGDHIKGVRIRAAAATAAAAAAAAVSNRGLRRGRRRRRAKLPPGANPKNALGLQFETIASAWLAMDGVSKGQSVIVFCASKEYGGGGGAGGECVGVLFVLLVCRW